MSDTLFKANQIVIKSEGKRVIDSNEGVSDRIRILSEILEQSQMAGYSDEYSDGFVEGLDATQVDMLFSDNPEGYEGEYDMATEGDGFTEGLAYAAPVSDAQFQQMLEDANAQAEEILESARQEAAQIVESASAESAEIRNRASEEGYQAGYQQGYDEGLGKVAEMESELNARREELENEVEMRISQLEPLFIDNITDIYSHVLGIDLKGQSAVVSALLHNAIRNIDGGKNFFIHVSQEDYETVLASKEDLAHGLGSQVTVEVIEDVTLKATECFIEAESGIYDCSLGTELELLRKELVMLSYRKES